MNKKELIDSLRGENFSFEILNAFKKVPREKFVAERFKRAAYEDTALPLEKGATISQPYTIAFMLSQLELKKGLKILEIGSGCGYVLALMSEITNGKIYGIEVLESLAKKSKRLLKNYDNVHVICGNGSRGLPNKAPFDRILVSAAAQKIPRNLCKQLSSHGVIVCPVENSIFQIKKTTRGFEKKEFPGFVFVPMV